ncbi:MAG: family 10 glycosylhydrolase [Prevotellaceae bacterium]|nr:family 10 glycosylhydrolase [Prevotellaceae bacterium]
MQHTTVHAQVYQKREFRGAWIQCVNGQFLGMGTRQMQDTLSSQLDRLKECGVNAIIFQVRPECDALYESKIEPWSRFLTGRQGKAPSPYWDPLAWMIEQCHKRGMELHAWINPFRAKTKTTHELSNTHIAIKHPESIFAYDGLLILNPGIQENRDYICNVVKDILERYDVDGLHIDDYFYPYPVAGQKIPDDKEFAAYNNGIKDKNDWRRDNVNVFIRQLYNTIHETKPWVKFGVSPFGIYRNKKSDQVVGSATNGLQNYDDLYADVLMWINNGWIDYCVPQLYWQIGHKAADYETLIKWWDKYAGNRHLYIGEDVERTAKFADLDNPNINQMPAKRKLHQEMTNVNGTVLWYAKAVVNNVGNYGSMLENVYWKYPALAPRMPYIDNKAPKKVRKMKFMVIDDEPMLFWTAPKGNSWKDKAERYVVYKFEDGERINLNDPSNIVAITTDEYYKLPKGNNAGYGKKVHYVVTSLDRMSNESKGKKKTIRY